MAWREPDKPRKPPNILPPMPARPRPDCCREGGRDMPLMEGNHPKAVAKEPPSTLPPSAEPSKARPDSTLRSSSERVATASFPEAKPSTGASSNGIAETAKTDWTSGRTGAAAAFSTEALEMAAGLTPVKSIRAETKGLLERPESGAASRGRMGAARDNGRPALAEALPTAAQHSRPGMVMSRQAQSRQDVADLSPPSILIGVPRPGLSRPTGP